MGNTIGGLIEGNSYVITVYGYTDEHKTTLVYTGKSNPVLPASGTPVACELTLQCSLDSSSLNGNSLTFKYSDESSRNDITPTVKIIFDNKTIELKATETDENSWSLSDITNSQISPGIKELLFDACAGDLAVTLDTETVETDVKRNASYTLSGCLTGTISENIQLDFNGGTLNGKDNDSARIKLGKIDLPSNVSRDKYALKGWSWNKNDSTAAYTGTSAEINLQRGTLYAVWEKQEFTATLNANGGTCNKQSVVTTDWKLPTLPDATPSNTNWYNFGGWYCGNTKYSGGQTLSGNIELTAVYTDKYTCTGKEVGPGKGYVVLKNTYDTADSSWMYIEALMPDTTQYMWGYPYIGGSAGLYSWKGLTPKPNAADGNENWDALVSSIGSGIMWTSSSKSEKLTNGTGIIQSFQSMINGYNWYIPNSNEYIKAVPKLLNGYAVKFDSFRAWTTTGTKANKQMGTVNKNTDGSYTEENKDPEVNCYVVLFRRF